MGRGPAGIPAPPGLPFYGGEGELGGREPLGWRTRCSLPPKPPILPQRAFFGRMERRDDASAFPASTVPREHEEKNLPKPRKETTAYQTEKARRYGGLLLCTAKQAAEKICRLRWHFCRTSGDRKAALPHSPLRRKQAHKAQGGNYKTPDLTPAGARQTCSCYGKGTGNTSRKRNPTMPLSGASGDGGHEESDDGPAPSHPPE